VSDARLDQVLAELRRFEGKLVTTTLPDEVRLQLEDALRDQISRGQPG
jgi:uncharacterized membrane protein